MLIKALTAIRNNGVKHSVGAILDVSNDLAKRLVSAGNAIMHIEDAVIVSSKQPEPNNINSEQPSNQEDGAQQDTTGNPFMEALMMIPDVTSEMATELVNAGIMSIPQALSMPIADFASVTGVSKNVAKRILAEAAQEFGE